MKQRTFYGVAGMCAVLAFGLAMFVGLRQSVWFDEAYSILVAQQPPVELVSLTAIDTHPPLYYLLLHVWGGIFGWGEVAVRSLSALFFSGVVVSVVALARKLFGWRVALVAGVLTAFSPLLVRYGFEVRMYAAATLIGCLATLVLVYAAEAPTQKNRHRFWLLLAVYAVLVAVGTLTLYNLVYIWCVHIVWLLYKYGVRTRSGRVKLLPWVGAYACSVVIALPWIPTLLKQLGNGALAPISEPMTLTNLLGVVTFNSLYQPVWALSAVLSLVAIAYFVALGYALWRARTVFVQTKQTVLPLLYIVVPITLLTLVSLVKPLYVERYLSFIAIGYTITLAAAIVYAWRSGDRKLKLASGILVGGMMLGMLQLMMVGNFNFQRQQRPEVREAAAFARSQCEKSNTVVLASDPYVATELRYYLPESCHLTFYSPYDTLGGGYAPIARVVQHTTDATPAIDASKVIVAYYDKSAVHPQGTVQERHFWGSLHLDVVTAE